jgi:Binding-protein-dependent transport system inner membrane component
VLFSVAIPDIWLTTSFMTLVLFAGLQNLPPDVIAAARLDGVSGWQLLTRIMLPPEAVTLVVVEPLGDEQQITDLDATRGPASYGRGRAVLHVVRVRDDAEHPLEGLLREGRHRPLPGGRHRKDGG